MILAAGLSPAWQQTLSFDRLMPGEVNRACETWRGASGKVVNVALAAHAMGAEVRLLTTTGRRTGDELRDDCAEAGFKARWIATESATRVCTTLIDRASGQVTELVENVPALDERELAAFVGAFREESRAASVVVFSGSLPLGAPESLIHDCLLDTRCPVVLDVRGPELMAALNMRPWLVKPNRRELATTIGRPLSRDEDVWQAIDELLRGGAQTVVVSDGSCPLWVATAEGLRESVVAPTVDVKSPIGSGDCLAAGFAVGASKGLSLRDALPIAIGMAAANAETQWPARFSADRARHWVEPVAERMSGSLRSGR